MFSGFRVSEFIGFRAVGDLGMFLQARSLCFRLLVSPMLQYMSRTVTALH